MLASGARFGHCRARGASISKTSATLRIEPFRSDLRHHFYALNAAWIVTDFALEPVDERVLSNPEDEILAHGGTVLFALLADEVVGTCALKQHAHGTFELTKMAVAPAYRRYGIGAKLIEAAIAAFEAANGRELFLESSTKLEGALRLYTRMGFVRQTQLRPGSEYARSDVYMIYRARG